MLNLLQTFWQLTRRRLGPEDLPDSAFLLAMLTVIYVASQFVFDISAYGLVPLIIPLIGIDLVLLFAFVWAVLGITGFKLRFRQTLTAMLGTGALLTLIATPFIVWVRMGGEVAPTPPVLALLVIIIWLIVVYAHIFARALSKPYLIGLVLAVTYYFLNDRILDQAIRQFM